MFLSTLVCFIDKFINIPMSSSSCCANFSILYKKCVSEQGYWNRKNVLHSNFSLSDVQHFICIYQFILSIQMKKKAKMKLKAYFFYTYKEKSLWYYESNQSNKIVSIYFYSKWNQSTSYRFVTNIVRGISGKYFKCFWQFYLTWHLD